MSSTAQFISFDAAEDGSAETQWLWHGLVAAGKVTLFTSLWKSGKTTLLAHYLARRRAGGEFLGLAVAAGGWPPVIAGFGNACASGLGLPFSRCTCPGSDSTVGS
jgi:hypothetical protein